MSFDKKNNYTLFIKCNSTSDEQHNYYLAQSNKCLTSEDSGIDLYIPSNYILNKGVHALDHMISCCMIDNRTNESTGYYLYPRSSIYKYPFILTNSIGIIDSGYRGNIKAMVRCFDDDCELEEGIRLFQICAPDLSPLKLRVVSDNTILPPSIRGTNGFGSSGH